MLSGCAYRYFDVEIKKSVNEQRKLLQVIAIDKEEKVTIFGQTKKTVGLRKYNGHVDIAAYSQDGVLLVETTAVLKRHSKKSYESFSVDLDVVLPSGSTIIAALHQERIGRHSKLKHTSTFTD
jgi:hypothetical protein